MIEQHNFKIAQLKEELAEEKNYHDDDKKSYQKMVKRFFKAYKSECRRMLSTQHSDLDFSKLEKITPNDLARLDTKEEATNKSISKQLRGPQRTGEKAIATEQSTSEHSGNLKVTGEKSIEADPSALKIQSSEDVDPPHIDGATNVTLSIISFPFFLQKL